MNLGDKIVCTDGTFPGMVFELYEFVPNSSQGIFKCISGEVTSTVIFTDEQLYNMMKIGRIRMLRNGIERAKDIANSR